MIRTRMFSVLAAPALLLPLLAPRPAAGAAAVPNVATCAKAIETQEQALEKTLLADFLACDKAYRGDQTSGKNPPDYSKSAKGCEKTLKGALGLGNNSAMDKIFLKLKGYATDGKTCNDTTLGLLGHLPAGKFGDIWARVIVMTALDKAYNQQLMAASDTVLMFQNMACYPGLPGYGPNNTTTPKQIGCLPPGASPTGIPDVLARGCPSCYSLIAAPCYQHACTYLTACADVTAGEACSHFDLAAQSGGHIPGDLQGVASFTMCQFTGETGSSVNPANEYLVIGGSDAKETQPIVINGLGWACSHPIADEGYISCGGSDGRVDYKTCQDSNTTSNPGACPGEIGTPDVCTPPSVDPAGLAQGSTGSNGGECITLTPNSAHNNGDTTDCTGGTGQGTCIGGTNNGGVCTANSQCPAPGVCGFGDAFVNLSQTLDVPLFANVGPDNNPCTSDDNEARAAATTFPLTTGQASTVNLNTPFGAPLRNGPVCGNPFTCGNIQSSSLSGGIIAGAFTAVSQPVLEDEATIFYIGCQ